MASRKPRDKKEFFERKWNERIDEAKYHADSLGVIIKAVSSGPKDQKELIRTLEYGLSVTREHYKNLVHCKTIGMRIFEDDTDA